MVSYLRSPEKVLYTECFTTGPYPGRGLDNCTVQKGPQIHMQNRKMVGYKQIRHGNRNLYANDLSNIQPHFMIK